MSKNIKKYGYIPSMEWLPIDALVIDHSYQRTITSRRSQKNIKQIIKNFQWRKFTPVVVSKNEDETYSVIDGQHRLEAAKVLGDIDELPCYIVDSDDTREQARSFVSINRDRVSMNPFNLHKSLAASGESIDCYVDEFCDRIGIRLSENGQLNKDPSTTLALSTIRNLLKNKQEVPLERAILTIRKAFPDKTGQLRSSIIKTLTILYGLYSQKINSEIAVKVLKGYGDIDTFEANVINVANVVTNVSRRTAALRVFISNYNSIASKSEKIKEL